MAECLNLVRMCLPKLDETYQPLELLSNRKELEKLALEMQAGIQLAQKRGRLWKDQKEDRVAAAYIPMERFVEEKHKGFQVVPMRCVFFVFIR